MHQYQPIFKTLVGGMSKGYPMVSILLQKIRTSVLITEAIVNLILFLTRVSSLKYD